MTDEIETPGDSHMAELESMLGEFLTSHPGSSVEAEDGEYWVAKPWGDETVTLTLDDDAEALAKALANVLLPSRFSAIYHRDTREMEFLWAAFLVDTEEDPDLVGRKFDLHFDGAVHECEWGNSSDRLITIARAAVPDAAPTATYWRNLSFYSRYIKALDDYAGSQPQQEVGVARSFWVRNLDWSEDRVTELARHISYYMKYYDIQTPIVSIHEEEQTQALGKRSRYPHGDFPTTIVGRRLDPYMLGLWETALLETDAFLKYLYCYQILEYATYYFLKRETASSVRRILVEPDVCARPEVATVRVLEILGQEMGKPEDQKLRELIREHVRPSEVWDALEPNREFFTQETVFDGGFRLDPLVGPSDNDCDCWAKTGVSRLADQLRYLRNALAHARDARGGGILKPSQGNYHSVRVWLQPMQVVATEVVLRSEIAGGS